MAIDPSIALGVRPPAIPQFEIQSPLDRYQKVLSLRALMEQGQMRGLQMQQAEQELAQSRQAAEGQAEFRRRVTAGETLTPGQSIGLLGPTAGSNYLKSLADAEKAKLDRITEVNTINVNNAKRRAQIASGVTDLEGAKKAAWQAANEGVYDLDPVKNMQIARGVLEHLQNNGFNADEWKQHAQESLDYVARQDLADKEAEAKRKQEKAPFELRSATAAATKAEQEAAGTQPITAYQQQELKLSKIGKTEPYPQPVQTQREVEWRLRLEQQNDPLGLLKSTPAPAAAAPGGSAPAGSAPEGSVSAFQSPGPGQEPRMIWIGPDGSKYTQPPSSAPAPAPAAAARPRYSQDLTGDTVLTTLPGAVAQQVKAIAEGRMAIPSGQALRTPYWQQMMGLVGQYDPSFDVNNPGKRLATAKDFTSGTSAKQVNSLNTVIGHLDSLSQAADRLNNTRFTAYNSLKNFISGNVGDPDIKTFDATKKAVTDELTRVWRGTGGSEGDIKTWSASLDAANSPSQLHAVIAQIGDLLESKLSALQDQYQEGMGTIAKGRQIITPDARRTLDRLEQKTGKTPPPAGGHVIEINGKKYQYKGSGATKDLANYDEIK